MPTNESTNKRSAFTDIERQKLRSHHQKYPGTSLAALASWFELQFGRKISTSSVYDILSNKYAYLDVSEASHATRRQRSAQLPDLEEALFKWWQEAQPRHVNGKELKDKANEIWQTIPACHEKKKPSFSDGWLTKWRNRHGLGKQKETSNQAFTVIERDSMQLQISANVLPFDLLPGFPNTSTRPGSIRSTDFGLNLPRQQMLPAAPMSLIANDVQTIGTGAEKRGSSLCPEELVSARGKRRLLTVLQARAKRRSAGSTSGQNAASGLDSFAHQPATMVRLASDYRKPSLSLDPNLWGNVWELFSKRSDRTTRDTILPAENILKAFDPILAAAENDLTRNIPYFSYDIMWREAMVSESRKAIGLLKTTGIFKLLCSLDERQTIIIEDWFLDFVQPEIARSPSPDMAGEGSRHSTTLVSKWAPALNLSQKPQSNTAISLTVGGGGKMAIWTRSYGSVRNTNEVAAVERFVANITITPPCNIEDSHLIPQTVFRLARETTQYSSTLLTPSIFSEDRDQKMRRFLILLDVELHKTFKWPSREAKHR